MNFNELVLSRVPRDEYDHIRKRFVLACVDVAIEFKGKILLVKRRDEPAAGQWWLPGGGYLWGEGDKDCALRKVREETRLSGRLGPVIHHGPTIFEDSHTVNTVFLFFADHNNVILDETSLDYRWSNYPENSYHPYIREVIFKVMNYIKNR